MGEVLLTLGTAGVRGQTDSTFNTPSDVVVAPNGDIFVADGHVLNAGDPLTNQRVVRFSKDGTFITAWGTNGTEPGQFSETHTIAMDSQGRIFVGDRRPNNRIQIFDQNGTFIDEWRQFGSPARVFIDQAGCYVRCGRALGREIESRIQIRHSTSAARKTAG